MARRLLLLVAISACTPGTRDFDPYPVGVDLTAGPILLEVSDGTDGARVPAVIDTLAPISVLDSFEPGVPLSDPHRREVDLLLYGADTGVARVVFQDATVVDMHPCAGADGGADEACRVGAGSDLRVTSAVVGTDLLSRGAVRVDFAASRLALFPDIAGSAEARGLACDAVLPNPFVGGGTLVIGGAEIAYSGRRTAVGVCTAFDPAATAAVDRGIDMMMVVSTGIGPTVLTESAYERYRSYCRTHDCTEPAAVGSLPETVLRVPAGPITGRLGAIDAIALVGEGSDERGPCQELFANHVLTANDCRAEDGETEPPVANCPCKDNATFCSTAAAVELPGAVEVIVLPDDTELLQAIRFELRPGLPEIDGIIGANALVKLSMDFDYPNDRLLMRCTDDTDCTARPAVRNFTTREAVAGCTAPAASAR